MEKRTVRIILHHYSIVIKGIERKIKELGHNVEVMEPDPNLIRAIAEQTDLFVIYLPKYGKNRSDDEETLNLILQSCDVIQSCKKSMIVIGEKNFRDAFMEDHPVFGECEWVERPVDMKVFTKSVERALADEEPSAKKHILIVDDDPAYANMVQIWIKDRYKTDILTSGKQVFPFLEKKSVDLILLDYEMPGMNGSQVLQMLRREPATKDLPVIFLTGVGTAEEVKLVLAMKPDGYILKTTPRQQILEYLAEKLS